jgi:NDP-sugar pyrophosphorylase family protein
MLERLINNFKSYGFYKFYISIHYLPEVIRSYFGDGSQFGIEITYIHEEKPLGTAGALSLLPKSLPKDPLIMINGDILTNVDFSRVIDFHVKKKNDATMCVREYSYQIPYGVINGNGKHIISMMEKPTKRFFVNAGIYVLSHHVVQSVKKNQRIDMPDLLQLHINDHQNILMFPIHEYWLDIGRMEDFQKAQQDINLKA